MQYPYLIGSPLSSPAHLPDFRHHFLVLESSKNIIAMSAAHVCDLMKTRTLIMEIKSFDSKSLLSKKYEQDEKAIASSLQRALSHLIATAIVLASLLKTFHNYL